jgi:hypothetical protein
MTASAIGFTRGFARRAAGEWRGTPAGSWWSQHREVSLNWLALGLLLAAWNASDNDPSPEAKRPESLRGYSHVSVRAQRLASMK